MLNNKYLIINILFNASALRGILALFAGEDEITSGLLFNLVWKNNCYLLAVSFDFWEIHCIFVKK